MQNTENMALDQVVAVVATGQHWEAKAVMVELELLLFAI
jgi:hypothetical protein